MYRVKVLTESDKVSDLEPRYLCDLKDFSEVRHLQAHRCLSWILVSSGTEESSCYGGISPKQLISQKKSDLQICGLPCCQNTLSPGKDKKPVLIAPTFASKSCAMADRKASSSRPEKSNEASGNAVSRFIRRLSPTKRYRGGETSGASSSSATQENASASKKTDSSATKNPSHQEDKHSKKLSKSFLNLSESASSSKNNLSQQTSPWISPAPSYQSLNQDERAMEFKLLSQLHSNFDQATNILGNYISLRDRKK